MWSRRAGGGSDRSVWVRDRTGVDVQVRAGVPTTVAIEAGATETLRIRNPWPGERVEAINAQGKTVLSGAGPPLRLPVVKGESYLLRRSGAATQNFAAITGAPAKQYKKLGAVQIGK